MDEKQYSYPLKLGISMFNADGALKPDAYQALYMQAVEPHLKNRRYPVFGYRLLIQKAGV